MAVESQPVDLRALILRGIETEELDYKAAQNWRLLARGGKAKFARHCLALANTKGGYIVVGVGEDAFGRPADFTGLTEAEAKSFDPTDVGSFINRCADPPIDFEIEKPVVDGRQYVIFVVRRFSDMPHVCVYSLNHELTQGAFYIRTKEASSRVAYRASEIHALIQRSLRNQREHLARMLRGILYESRQSTEPDAEQLFREQVRVSREFTDRHLRADKHSGQPLGVVAFPHQFIDQRFSLSDLRQAVSEANYTFRGNPFATIGSDEQTYFTNVSMRSYLQDQPAFWQIFQSGLFHHHSRLPLHHEGVAYDELRWRVAEAVFFVGQLYSALGCEEDLITLEFHLDDVEGRRLSVPPEAAGSLRYTCRIPAIHVQIARSAPNLVGSAAQHSARIIREISERFNYPAGKHGSLEESLNQFYQRDPG